MNINENKPNEETNVEDTNDQKDMLIHRLHNKDFVDLKKDVNSIVAAKINNKVQNKKQEILYKINGTESESEKSEED